MRTSNLSDAATTADPRFPFPAAFFVAALIADVAFWRTADPLWTTLASWLLLGGLILAGIAVLSEIVRALRRSRVRRPAAARLLGDGIAFVLSILNFIFHVRDGYSAVAPVGPLLSAVVVVILLLGTLVEWDLVRRLRAKEA